VGQSCDIDDHDTMARENRLSHACTSSLSEHSKKQKLANRIGIEAEPIAVGEQKINVLTTQE